MIFKNARVFRFTKPITIDPDQLEQKLRADQFKPCGPQETSRMGWASPLGNKGEYMVYAAGGCMLICLKKEEKILPGPVIKEMVEERCEDIETEQGRKVRKKEKDEIKEQIMLECLPKAFSRTKRTFAYLSPKDGFMVVDHATASVAEELASALRKSLGSLPVRPPVVQQAPAFTFTGWANETIDRPESITLGTKATLVDPSEEGGKISVDGIDLGSDEIRNHIDAGMQVTKISLGWDDSVKFVLNEELAITGLKFGETFQEKLDDVDADDALAKFDAAFGLMTLELSRMIPGLFEVLGGEDDSAIVTDLPATELTAYQKASESDDSGPAQPVDTPAQSDNLYPEVEMFVVDEQRASISGVQRKFKIGYNRAAHLVEELERRGVVSPAGNDGVREVLKAPAMAS
ncbi:recombination-associated protein RdgC [Marinobacter sp.]|uniref:recombination-associated protein RdgC n=1 Tax=Marinobacter sp. TaxID=50741 RepID=UPI00356648AD